MMAFRHEAKARFGFDRLVCSRVGNLFVHEVSAPFEIREHEGKERIVDVSRRKDIVMAVAEKNIPEIPVRRADTVMASPECRGVPAVPTKKDMSTASPPGAPAIRVEARPMLDRISSAFQSLTEPTTPSPAPGRSAPSASKSVPKAAK